MSKINESMSLANPAPPFLDMQQKLASALGAIGLLILLIALGGYRFANPMYGLMASLGLICVGTVWFSIRAYLTKSAGIKNDGVYFSAISYRGLAAWIAGIVITGFYILLYWFPQVLGQVEGANRGLVGLFDPLSFAIKGSAASQWFVYGVLYTVAILAFGIKFILKYRHNKYQVVRTISVMFFQLGFAFLIPEFLQALHKPYYNFANMWPLNYYFFDGYNMDSYTGGTNFGLLMILWGLAMVFIISPILTYFYGKRWYCSWVCGCGGLAETAGDPFRQLSDKSIKAWNIERWMIHGVLLFSFVMTAGVLSTYFSSEPNAWISKNGFLLIMTAIVGVIILFTLWKKEEISQSGKNVPWYIIGASLGVFSLVLIAHFSGYFLLNAGALRKWYGFFIGSAFSGVVGVGFYPLMGSRVWCRFGCPMAAILGLQQKFFSRFRITTNGGQCISCGNCSTYCEMGIDVRAYAQKGQNIVRASCVGCGVCSAVCPRGVLRLEGGSADLSAKTAELKTIHITEDQIKILS